MMPPNFESLIEVKELIYPVRLGKGEKERSTHHTISIDIYFGFIKAPRVEQTDCIEDTICYSQVSKLLATLFGEREYHMLEHLTRVVFDQLKREYSSQAQIRVAVHKLRPPVNCLQGGVKYICGDWV